MQRSVTSRAGSGRILFPGRVEGEALVATTPFPLSGVTFDFKTGIIRWQGHELNGQSVRDKILVLPEIRAFAGGDWALFSLSTLHHTGPRAIICGEIGPFVAAGTILGRIPAISSLPKGYLKTIENGTWLRVDSQLRQITAPNRSASNSAVDYRIADRVDEQIFILTPEEQNILAGSRGQAAQECLELLVQFGKAVGADRLIEVESVHAAGAGYNTTGNATTEYLNQLSKDGARVCVPATLNPIAVDRDRWQSVMHMPQDLNAHQIRLNDAFQHLGFDAIYSCAPYWTGHRPAFGSMIVWSEHNAASFANSVLGARTNFESNIATIWAAMTGRIPLYGLYLSQNREPSVRVEVTARLEDPVDWRCLGVAIANVCGNRIPIVAGLKEIANEKYLRDLCASFGPPWTSSPMLHVEGVTPEAHLQSDLSLEKIQLTQGDLDLIRSELVGAVEQSIDLVALGCPQYAADEILAVAARLRGKRIKQGVHLWIWTDARTRKEAEQFGAVQAITDAGGQVLSDTCGCAACPIQLSSFGFRSVITDSTKSHGFLSKTGLRIHLGSMSQCIEAALSGVWPASVQCG